MIEVTVSSVRISLMSQHRVVVLKDAATSQYLPIWIGPFEAEAITAELQGVRVPRPMTHDLLRNVIAQLGAQVTHVAVTALRGDTFFARIYMDADGQEVEVDSRPSDAIALAVRANVPIYVSESVLAEAGMEPEVGLSLDEDDKLAPYRDFMESLDLPGAESTEK